jgi:hypothetical protein
MAEYLFKVQQYNRLSQKGLLKRFSIDCYGKQLTLEGIREEKAKKFKELSNKRNSKEWEYNFLKYDPSKKDEKKDKKNKKRKTQKKSKTKRRRKRKKRRTQRLFNF